MICNLKPFQQKRKNSVKTGKPLLKIGKSNNIHIFIYKYETV